MKTLMVALAVGALILLVVLARLRAATASAEGAAVPVPANAVVVDVRTPAEFAGGHAPRARNIPLDRLPNEFPRLVPDKGQAVFLYCRSGRRSGLAEQQLRALGYTNVHNLGSLERARSILGGATE